MKKIILFSFLSLVAMADHFDTEKLQHDGAGKQWGPLNHETEVIVLVDDCAFQRNGVANLLRLLSDYERGVQSAPWMAETYPRFMRNPEFQRVRYGLEWGWCQLNGCQNAGGWDRGSYLCRTRLR